MSAALRAEWGPLIDELRGRPSTDEFNSTFRFAPRCLPKNMRSQQRQSLDEHSQRLHYLKEEQTGTFFNALVFAFIGTKWRYIGICHISIDGADTHDKTACVGTKRLRSEDDADNGLTALCYEADNYTEESKQTGDEDLVEAELYHDFPENGDWVPPLHISPSLAAALAENGISDIAVDLFNAKDAFDPFPAVSRCPSQESQIVVMGDRPVFPHPWGTPPPAATTASSTVAAPSPAAVPPSSSAVPVQSGELVREATLVMTNNSVLSTADSVCGESLFS